MLRLLSLTLMTVFALYGAEQMGLISKERILPAPLGAGVQAGTAALVSELREPTNSSDQQATDAALTAAQSTEATTQQGSFTHRIAAKNKNNTVASDQSTQLIEAF